MMNEQLMSMMTSGLDGSTTGEKEGSPVVFQSIEESNSRHETRPDGAVIVDGDPYIVYNDEMKAFAGKLFKESEDRGYKTKEDKARYLSGRIFEMSPFGVHKDSMKKDAIGLFNGLMSDDKEQHHLACVHKGIVQRALLESQGVKTRNSMFEIVPFTYPMKPVKSPGIKRMNAIAYPLLAPVARMGLSFPHYTMDAWVCDNEEKEEGCRWQTIDATFDDTTRMLKIRPDIDMDLVLSEDHPGSILEWKDAYVDSSPFIKTLYNMAEAPLTKWIFRRLFKDYWFTPLLQANEHVK